MSYTQGTNTHAVLDSPPISSRWQGLTFQTTFSCTTCGTVPFHVQLRNIDSILDGIKEIRKIYQVDIGTLHFRERGLQEMGCEETAPDHRTIYLDGFNSTLGNPLMNHYTALAIHAVEGDYIRAKNVLDIGSGDGVLGLVAHRRGASHVTAVDINPSYRTVLFNHLQLNRISADTFDFVYGDINLPKIRTNLPLGEIEVVISNIGPHYEKTDRAGVSLLDHLPRATLFIGGSYLETPSHEKYSVRPVWKTLQQKGFRIIKKVVDTTPDFPRRIAFVAQRS